MDCKYRRQSRRRQFLVYMPSLPSLHQVWPDSGTIRQERPLFSCHDAKSFFRHVCNHATVYHVRTLLPALHFKGSAAITVRVPNCDNGHQKSR